MTNPNELFDRLISQLYEGVLTDEGWSQALSTIATVTQSPQASIVVFDQQTQALAINESFGTFQEVVAAYNAHYHLVDEALFWVDSAPPGSWYLDCRDLGEHVIQRSAYYQDYFLRCDMATTLCNRLLGEGGINAFLSLQRRSGQPHYTDADLAAFGQFIPHVQRAVYLRLHMRRLAERTGLASIALNGLRIPLLVLDEQGRILLANAEAETLLQRQPLLAVHQGCLQPRGLHTGQFARLLRSACGLGGPATAGGALVTDALGQPALRLLVQPLPTRLQTFNQWARPLALVVLHDPSQPQSMQPCLLQQLYGLTPAEARLTLALCQGDTPAEAAQRAGVGIGTVRTQLRSIFAKTGAERQTDLIRMLAALQTVV